MVFDILRRVHRPRDYINPKAPLCWVPEVTHICKLWRTIALSAPTLWTDIHVEASIPWADEFACRSRGALVCVTLGSPIALPGRRGSSRPPGVYDYLKRLILQDRQRIQSIDLQWVDKSVSEVFSTGGTEPGCFTNLEDLKISLGDPRPFVLTSNVLSAPKLKKLDLWFCSAEPDFAYHLHNLSHLSIQGTLPFLLRMSGFLRNALLNIPDLERLSLGNHDFFTSTDGNLGMNLYESIAFNDVPLDFGVQPAILPKLHHIDILELPVEWIISLLQNISCGPQRRLVISRPQEVDRFDQIFRLIDCVVPHAIQSCGTHRLKLDLSGRFTTDLLLAVWRDGQSPNPAIRLSLSGSFLSRIPSSHAHTCSLLDGVLRRMNYQDLQTLELHLAEPLSTQEWLEFFGDLQSLNAIVISGRGEKELFGALVDGLSEDLPVRHPVDTIKVLPFPAIKHLTFEGVEAYEEADIEFMIRCLRKRRLVGSMLELLRFYVRSDAPRARGQLGAFGAVVNKIEVLPDPIRRNP